MRMLMGWHLDIIHFGASMNGFLSTMKLMISNDALPEPMIIPAFSVVTGISEKDRILATS